MAPRSPAAGLVLAAGKGTRMKSDLPKALHEVAGVPMVQLVVSAAKSAGVARPIVVVGYQGDLVREALDGQVGFAEQDEQLGTGHAALMAADLLKGHDGPVLVTPGDTPLLSSETLRALLERFEAEDAQAVMATFVTFDPKGYGRIVRDADGLVERIVEEKDATVSERAIQEVNPAVYVFDCRLLMEILPGLGNTNAQGEYYLTDAIAEIRKRGGRVVAEVFDDPDEFMGVNDRWQLAEAARIMRLRILRRHAMNGVTIVDPTSTYIGFDVELEPDVLIQPMTVIEGGTKISAGAEIGPNAWIKDSTIGRGCRVFMSHVDQATMEECSRCGPFSNLRPGTKLGRKVKVGNFVEIKNSDVGELTAVSHLTYIGDSTVGSKANIGAGTITCNYDGYSKNRTEIGDGAFIGSNSTIIAPRTIGAGAFVAAGSVVSQDVPEDAMAIGRARQENKEGWAKSWRDKQSNQKP
ncbi:MAG: bifunctional UDP-N-acetylglucosamine diphosphorylase/glucosamine-1-phosphate N-acetyltransferase GlmU [Armatimonadetes bacterium]|nr:bifunctional UDP-N-acetylglucosamine diphosphorylase/glucosamine-1-phosphate N-acetyltransferase GlmU [Armatimonadota bacterium]